MRRLAASLGLCAMAACKHAPPPEPRVVDLSHDFGADTIYWPTEEGFVHEPGSAGQTAGGYYYEADAGEWDTFGILTIRLAKDGVRQEIYRVQIVAYDPYEAPATAADRIADHTLRRNTDNVEASSDGDAVDQRSLYGAVAQHVHKKETLTGPDRLRVYESDDTTTLADIALTTDAAADPITAMDPP